MNKEEIAKKEFTRQMLDLNMPSTNFEQVTRKYSNTQGSFVKYGQFPDSGKTHGLNVFSTSVAAKSLTTS